MEAQGNIFFQRCRSRGRHRQPKLSLQSRGTHLSSPGLCSTCSLSSAAPQDGVSEHAVWLLLGSLPSVAVDSNSGQKTKQSGMPWEHRSTDAPGHRLLCVAGAEWLRPRSCAPNLLAVRHRHGVRATPRLCPFGPPQMKHGFSLCHSSPASLSHSSVTQKLSYDYFQLKCWLASIYSH